MEWRTFPYPTHTAQPAQEIRLMPSGHKLAFCNLLATNKSNKVIEFMTLIQLNTLANSFKLLPPPCSFLSSLSFPFSQKLVKIQPPTHSFCKPVSLSLHLSSAAITTAGLLHSRLAFSPIPQLKAATAGDWEHLSSGSRWA